MLGSFLFLEQIGVLESPPGSIESPERWGQLGIVGLGQVRFPDFPLSDSSSIHRALGTTLHQLFWMETSRMAHKTQDNVSRGPVWIAWKNNEDRSNFGDRKDEGSSRRGLLAYLWHNLDMQ